jgi:branched-chain amino acid transport system permease protein
LLTPRRKDWALGHFREVLPLSRTGLLILTAFLAAPFLIRNQYLLNLMVMSLYFGAQAMAFDFTAGYIGIVNFGFAGFLGLGAYISALLSLRAGLSPWWTVWIGAAGAAVLGWLTGLLTLRLRGIFAAVMAWFVSLELLALCAALAPLTRGFSGLNVPLFVDSGDRRPYYYILLAISGLSYLVLRAVTRSRIGLAFRALGQNLEVARASGINPRKYRVLNFTLSCFFAGLLGGFYGHSVGILTPEVMHTRHTVEVLALAYIGGRGTLWGGVLAAFLIIPLFEYLKPLFEIRLVIYGLMLIAVIVLYPNGLASLGSRRVEGKENKSSGRPMLRDATPET